MRSLLRAGVVSCLILAVQFSSSNASASGVAPVAASVTAGAGIAADTATSVAPVEKPRLRMRVVRRFGKHDGYVVRVRYPQFSGTPTDLVLQLNRDIRRHVDMNVPATGNEYTEFRYSCDFETFLVTPDAVSILFIFEDNFQGAHPVTRTAAFNRQLYPRYRILTLSDLVRRPVNYRYLQSRSAPRKSDLTPSDFANFTFNKKVIQLNFPEGRYGPPLELDDARISLTRIRRVVPPTSPIYRYVRRTKRYGGAHGIRGCLPVSIEASCFARTQFDRLHAECEFDIRSDCQCSCPQLMTHAEEPARSSSCDAKAIWSKRDPSSARSRLREIDPPVLQAGQIGNDQSLPPRDSDR